MISNLLKGIFSKMSKSGDSGTSGNPGELPKTIMNLTESESSEYRVGAVIERMNPQDFQLLRNRNFYRFGTYLSCPNSLKSGTRSTKLQFRIRVDGVKLKKKQKKILRKWQRFLNPRVNKSCSGKDNEQFGDVKQLVKKELEGYGEGAAGVQHFLDLGFLNKKELVKEAKKAISKHWDGLKPKLNSFLDKLHRKLVATFNGKESRVLDSKVFVGLHCTFFNQNRNLLKFKNQDFLNKVNYVAQKSAEEFVNEAEHLSEEIALKPALKTPKNVIWDLSQLFTDEKVYLGLSSKGTLFLLKPLSKKLLTDLVVKNQGILAQKYLKKVKKGKKDSAGDVNLTEQEIKVRNFFTGGDLNSPLNFEIRLEKPTCTDEKFDIYSQYFREIQGAFWGVSRSGLEQTWCQSPFPRPKVYFGSNNKIANLRQNQGLLEPVDYFPQLRDTSPENPLTIELGNYHLCFYLNGKLVAVSTMDLLPSTICSLYFFYHPKLKIFNFGKFSVMMEMALLRILRGLRPDQNITGGGPIVNPETGVIDLSRIPSTDDNVLNTAYSDLFRFENLGSYAISDAKAVYKTEFGPSAQLLCPTILDYADVGYFDRTIKAVITQKVGLEKAKQMEMDIDLSRGDLDSEHLKVFERLIGGVSKIAKPSQKGRTDFEFGVKGEFGEETKAADKDLRQFLKKYLVIIDRHDKVVKLSDDKFNAIVDEYEWYFRSLGKRLIKGALFRYLL